MRLFNEESFFEAHEVLESLWREEKGEDRDFYQGLIQIAAAFVHYQKKNPAGHSALLRSAFSYLQKYGASHLSFPLEALLRETKKCLEGGEKIPKIQYGLKRGDSSARR